MAVNASEQTACVITVKQTTQASQCSLVTTQPLFVSDSAEQQERKKPRNPTCPHHQRAQLGRYRVNSSNCSLDARYPHPPASTASHSPPRGPTCQPPPWHLPPPPLPVPARRCPCSAGWGAKRAAQQHQLGQPRQCRWCWGRRRRHMGPRERGRTTEE